LTTKNELKLKRIYKNHFLFSPARIAVADIVKRVMKRLRLSLFVFPQNWWRGQW